MSDQTAVATQKPGDIMERVLMAGDLSRLTPQDRVTYYGRVCESMGLNPLTRPFDYLNLSGKLVLYANKSCTEQLRKLNGVSITKLERELADGIYVVTANASDKDNRTDASIGAVPLGNLQGEARANAMMKAETKAKRRVTLSISGLGWLDESEVDSIPGAQRLDATTVEAGAPLPPAAAPASPAEPPRRGPGRPPNAKPPVKLVDDGKLPPAEVKAAISAVEKALGEKVHEPEVVQEPGVTQPTPPQQEVQPPQIDQTEVVGTTPIARETQQAIFRGVSTLNKAKGGGTAQKLIVARHADGRPINKLTNEEGLSLVEAMEQAAMLDGAALQEFLTAGGRS